MDKYFWLRISLNVFQLLAFITGLVFWKKIRNSYWKWFVGYLALIFLTEITAKYVGYGLHRVTLNANIYFFFGVPLQFLFFDWLFYTWFEQKREKKIALISAALYILAWIADLVYLREKNFWFPSFSYTAGNVILLFLIILFFIRFVNSQEILVYRSSMMFWVCLGLLLFYLGTFPFFALRNTLYYNYKNVFYPYWYISFVLNYLMYLFFAMAIIWGKPK